jgi:hypothetical protein
MFRRATSRQPNPKELSVLHDNLRYHIDYFSTGDGARAKAFLSQGDSKPDSSVDARQLAAYTAVASLILNLDETITRE